MKRIKTTYKKIEVIKLRHAGMLIKFKGGNLYIDPFKLGKSLPKADMIFLTHEHFDHCDPDSIKKIFEPGRTVLVGNQAVLDSIVEEVEFDEFVQVEPEESLEVRGLRIETVPAYNLDKYREPNVPFHPRDANGVGYILHLGSVQLYHTGDTDPVPELDKVSGVEILCVPVSGKYVMTSTEAAEVTKKMQPDVVVPIHVDHEVVGTPADIDDFEEQLSDTKVEVLR